MSDRIKPPTIISIETTTACPSSCVMCPREKVLARRKNFTLPIPTIEKIFSEITWPTQIQWGWINEPLADPRIFDIIKRGAEHNLRGFINSNAALLDEKTAERLFEVAPSLDFINFAVDSLVPEKYEAVRVGLKFETTITNIKRFLKENDRRGHPVKVWVSQVQIPGVNEGEFNAFMAYWENCGYRIDTVQPPCYRRRGADHDETFGAIVPVSNYCYFIENEMNITVDGDVPLCACDAQVLNRQANINEVSVYDAWNTPDRVATIEKIRKFGQRSLGFCKEQVLP